MSDRTIEPIELTLPYPPSVNHYWRHTLRGHFRTKHAKRYVRDVTAAVMERGHAPERLGMPLSISIVAFPPDRKRRDLDNLLKAILDSLERAGVYRDDNQIQQIQMSWGEVHQGGKIDAKLNFLP